MRVRRRLVVVSALFALVLGLPGPAAASQYQPLPDDVQSWVPNGRVYDILTVGDTVYIGGTFTRLRNPVTGQRVDRARLAAFDRLTGAVTEWDPGADGRVRALASGPDGVVYVGGLFTAAGGRANTNLATIGADGAALSEFRSSPNNEVRDLLHSAGGLFVAGKFTRVDGVARVGVARVDAASGVVDRAFNARLGYGRAFALEEAAGQLVVGGNYATVSGQPWPYLGSFDPADGTRTTWAPPTVCDSCLLLDVVVDEGRLYAAVGGPGGGRVAAWSLDSAERLWVRRGDGDVQAIDTSGGLVYAGGHFGPEFDGQERHQLAVLDSDGLLLPMTVPFAGNDAPGLWAVDAQADHLRLGGGFQGIAGSSAARYAVLPAAPVEPPLYE